MSSANEFAEQPAQNELAADRGPEDALPASAEERRRAAAFPPLGPIAVMLGLACWAAVDTPAFMAFAELALLWIWSLVEPAAGFVWNKYRSLYIHQQIGIAVPLSFVVVIPIAMRISHAVRFVMRLLR